MNNKHDLPIAAHAVIMTRGPVLRLVVRDDVADEVACQHRNNGVACDVVQLVRNSDALAAIQRLEAENEALTRVVGAARAVADGPEDLGEDFLVPSHLMAPLSLALDDLDAMTKEQKT